MYLPCTTVSYGPLLRVHARIHRSYSDQMLLLRFHACESETLETHSFHLHTNKDASKYSQNINVRRGHSKLNAAH